MNNLKNSVLLLILYIAIVPLLSNTILLFFNDVAVEQNAAAHNAVNLSEMLVNIIFIVLIQIRFTRNKGFYNFTILKPITFLLLIPLMLCISILQPFTMNLLYRYDSSDINQYKLLFFIIVILLLLTSIHLLKINSSKAHYEDITKLLTKQIDTQITHYQIFKEQEEFVLRFQHDYKNVMLGLQAILETGNVKEAQNYINEMESAFTPTTKLYNTGNPIADALLYTKNREASNKHVTIVFEGIIPAERITNLHLCILLTNTLDNAIEACPQKIGSEILIDSNIQNSLWFLEIKNSVEEKIQIKNNMLYTSKKNKRLHGFGIRNMQDVIDKYDGHLTLSCDTDYFVTEIDIKL